MSIYPTLLSSHFEVLEGFFIILRVWKARHKIFFWIKSQKTSVNLDHNFIPTKECQYLRFLTFSTPLPNMYIKPRPLWPIAFPCRHKTKQESSICFTDVKEKYYQLTASAAFLNHAKAVLLSCFTAVLPSEYICWRSRSDYLALNVYKVHRSDSYNQYIIHVSIAWTRNVTSSSLSDGICMYSTSTTQSSRM